MNESRLLPPRMTSSGGGIKGGAAGGELVRLGYRELPGRVPSLDLAVWQRFF